jgi:HD-GYP domain-containing protein (c-di-GMP phosphodiesterase class II)
MLKFRDLQGHKGDHDRGKKGGPGESEEMVNFEESGSHPAEDKAQGPELTQRAESLYGRTCDYLQETFQQVKGNVSLSLDGGAGLVGEIVDATVGDALFTKALHGENGSDFLVTHSANVAVYAIKMGAGLGFRKEQQIELGLTALLHDVGKCLVSGDVLYKEGELSKKELETVRESPNHGYELLKPLATEHPYLAECCLQVYERADGSGYPKGLEGNELHEYAQIIGLVDFYEALTHTRPHRDKFLPFAAVKEIIKSGKSAYPRKHLKALLTIFSIFPLHSCVKLNSHAIGRVIKTYVDQPMRPRLRIISDSQGSPVLTEQIVNLPEHPLLYIVDSVRQEEVPAVA